MNLEQLQRAVLDVIQQPLTASDGMRRRTLDGRAMKPIVDGIVKPNDRLTSFERLEIYNRMYWFRILAALGEDFPGLRAVIGQRNFDRLLVAYLNDCPSQSFTLRNLGSRLENWLRANPRFAPGRHRIALDMVRLEWADIDVFDSAELPALTEQSLSLQGENPSFHLQPYIRLLDLAYPVDDLLLSVKAEEQPENEIASNVVLEHSSHARTRRWKMPRPKKTYLAVHRQEMSVYFKRLEPEAFALLQALQRGMTLAEAIEVSVQWRNQEVGKVTGNLRKWFANWASLGWFCKPQES
jgi:hypothetical protein